MFNDSISVRLSIFKKLMGEFMGLKKTFKIYNLHLPFLDFNFMMSKGAKTQIPGYERFLASKKMLMTYLRN